MIKQKCLEDPIANTKYTSFQYKEKYRQAGSQEQYQESSPDMGGSRSDTQGDGN